MSSFSLKQGDKIVQRAEYLRIGREGTKIRSAHFIILYAENRVAHCRFGITATRKIGGAVERNRIKRVLREFFRLNRAFFRPSTDFIFIAGKGSAELSYADVRDELLSAFKKRNVLSALTQARS